MNLITRSDGQGGAVAFVSPEGLAPMAGGQRSGLSRSTGIYWTTDNGIVAEANLNGTDVTTLVTGQDEAFEVAVGR